MKQDVNHTNADSIIILDFETTGLAPEQGHRAIEIGAVRLENGVITDRFQELMNPGFKIDSFIENFTGITNDMLAGARPCAEVMVDFADFLGAYNLVAHNSVFDQSFLDAELKRIDRSYSGSFACSMQIARRLYPDAPNHKLGQLIEYRGIPVEGSYHRALADSEMTAKLWLTMLIELQDQYRLPHVPFNLMQQLANTPKARIQSLINREKKQANLEYGGASLF